MSKCDGLWQGDDGASCEAPVVQTCICARCERETEDERFHACADPAHKVKATQRHLHVRGRLACWALV